MDPIILEFRDAADTHGARMTHFACIPDALALRGDWFAVEQTHREAERQLGTRFGYTEHEDPNGYRRMIDLSNCMADHVPTHLLPDY